MGDGLLLEFPSVVAAVECAIAIQKLMVERNAEIPEAKRVVYRIGVNLGDVLIEGDDILGDGVNIAARLEGLCEPGGVLISGAAYEHIRGRIDAEFVDLGEKDLKNIARPVRVYSLAIGSSNDAPTQAKPAPTPAPEKFAPPHLSMVVLPFANIGGDPAHEHFVDGVTESLTTDLSRIRGAVVIARNTAFTYKGKPVDVKAIGRELGVRYMLEGSVRRLGENVEVNAQLISTETGAHVWADRFEGERSKLGELQVDVVARLANSLGVELVKAEALRSTREQSGNPDAVDLAMQAQIKRDLPDSKATINQAVTLAERALALDPQNVRALTVLASALLDRATDQFSDDPAGDMAHAEKAIDAAWALQP